MDRIILFFRKYISVFVFILLEIAAILLVVRKNDLQQGVVFRYSTDIVARCYSFAASVESYFYLDEVNEHLVAENNELRAKLDVLQNQLSLLATDSIDLPIISSDVEYISAKVVHNSVYRTQNFIIVNKGAKDGIQADMGVISPQGVVGVVTRVSNNYAVVMPIINPSQHISVKIKSNQQLGMLVWDGIDPKFSQMEEIPSHVNPIVGDTIVTSGYSAIFPEGLTIGVIDKAINEKHAPFCMVNVKLAVDFQSLSYVTITAFKNRSELINLSNAVLKDE